MQEAEEQDTCRICSAPAEPDQPLFYPCKCSGTIRYIHQDCLTTWLSHSKKKSCDVCKYPYAFTKVYAPDMPARLPPVLLLKRLAQQSFYALLFGVRAVAVAIVWLALLPWITIWTWRMYFSMGESTAWWISDRPRQPSTSTTGLFKLTSFSRNMTTPFLGETLLERMIAHPVWLAVSTDIFTGQIIASLVVLAFVAVFLLREWISQNARPGVFEDEEVPPEERLEVPAQPQPAPQLQVPPALANAVPGPLAVAPTAPTAPDAQSSLNVVNTLGPQAQPFPSPTTRTLNDPSAENVPARTRRRLHSGASSSTVMNDEYRPVEDRRSRPRRRHLSRISGVKRRIDSGVSSESGADSSPELEPQPQPQLEDGLKEKRKRFEFTFRMTARLPRRIEKTGSGKGKEKEKTDDIAPSQAATQPSSSSTLFSFGKIDESSSAHSLASASVNPGQSLFASPFTMSSASLFTSPSSAAGPSSESQRSPPAQSGRSTPSMAPRRPKIPPAQLPPTGQGLLKPSSLSPNELAYRAPELLKQQGKDNYFAEDLEEDEDEDESFERKILFKKIPRGSITGSGSSSSSAGEDSDSDEEAKVFNNDVQDTLNHGEGLGMRRRRVVEDAEDSDEDEAEGSGEGNEYEDEEEEDEDEVHEDFEVVDQAWRLDRGNVEDLNVARPIIIGDNAARANAEIGPLPAVGNAPPLAEPAEDQEGNVEDDMEGAMEAIGMRGPIYGIIQNAALMIFVLDTAIGLGIWIPFTIGKSTALLSLDPHRFLQILHLPIRAMRIITDPIVDSCAFLLLRFIFPGLVAFSSMLLHFSFSIALYPLSKLFGSRFRQKIVDSVAQAHDKISTAGATNWGIPLPRNNPSRPGRTSRIPSETWIDKNFPKLVEKAEPYFTALGQEVRFLASRTQVTWKRLALGSGPAERTFAVILGYVVVGVALSLYLNILTVGNVKTAGRAVRTAVRQQLLVFKVAAFIFIELVSFPLGCGIVLDLCTVWLFPEANLVSRAMYFYQAPLTATFYHWVAGTMFMYSFAILLSGCRTIIRPGAMWFIKDPQDQNSHPIRDILDRPTITQLRKIFVSALMYTFVVACVVGSFAGLLLVGSKSIMPFRWKSREPISSVPVDLLFVHSVLPYTMYYFRPKRVLRKASLSIWKILAARLRLSSYFFGGRYADEEISPENWAIVFSWGGDSSGATGKTNGSFRRVPNTDHVALTRDMRATAAVRENGEPVDETASTLIKIQNAEAEKAKRDPKADYTVVYIPPQFRYRILTFIVLLWIAGALALGLTVAIPIQVGRSFFRLFTPTAVHDGYSLIAGFYLFWMCYLVGKSIDRLDKRRQRRLGYGPRGDLFVLVIKRGLLWLAKISYMLFFLSVVIPTLVAFVVELYIVLPLRFIFDPMLVPRLRVVDTWAMGLLFANIALHVHRMQAPGNRLAPGLQNIANNGWIHPDPVNATREVIAPVIFGLLGMILFPFAVYKALRYVVPFVPADNKIMFMFVYPGIFAFAGAARGAVVSFSLLSVWSQSIRDKEFLVEMRLKNLEPQKEEEGAPTGQGERGTTEEFSD